MMNLQALEKKHKELGEEIERLKQTEGVWVPVQGDRYYRVEGNGTHLIRVNMKHISDLERISFHNCYQTETLAKKASIMQRQFNLITQVCLNFDPDFEPDWNDGDQRKYAFCYDNTDDEWRTHCTWTIDATTAYVSTPAIADKVVAYLNSQEIK
jgi:hypothetical protein